MSGFGAFLAKERLEIVRTWRIWVIPGMLVFFAVTSPIIALVTPALLGSLAGSEPGMVIQIPDPTALDAYGQFLKNLSQLVILAVVIAGAGTVSAERSSGTAILVLTKPVSRAAFVLAKLASHLGLLVVSTAVAALITLVVTRALFPPIPAMPLFGAVALWLVHAALLVSAMTFFSVVTPVDGGAEGLVARYGGAPAPSQQLERVVQSLGDLLRSQDAHPSGGQLNGQGNAVQTAANLHDRAGVGFSEPKGRKDVTRSFDEELNRLVLEEVVWPKVGPGRWKRQRRYQPGPFTIDAEPLAAGRQDGETGALAQEKVDLCGAGVDQVLTVVEHEGQPTSLQRVQHTIGG